MIFGTQVQRFFKTTLRNKKENNNTLYIFSKSEIFSDQISERDEYFKSTGNNILKLDLCVTLGSCFCSDSINLHALIGGHILFLGPESGHIVRNSPV